MKKAFILGATLMGFILNGCDNPAAEKETTYYYQTGGVSNTAYNVIMENPGLEAQHSLIFCNQYPVTGDIYRETVQGFSRTQLENDLDLITASGFSKTQFLRTLDSAGTIFEMFLMPNSDKVYFYVEKE
ncbi:MAG: hypothetical protein LBG90_00030 [Spirochaetaceae bacterium]|nr:hypothetical protein [Spirochaetaceae bacterium]